MKFKLSGLIITYSICLSAFCQTNWTLSNTGIPTGYSPNDFAIAANGDLYLIASQYNGTSFSPKLLKSTNKGTSWLEITTNGLTNVQNTNSIIYSGSKLLLAGSNSSTASYYVYSSIDNGVNWTLSNTGIPTGYSPNDFTLAANGDVYLIASQYNGTSFSPKLLKSTNSGASWSEITMSGLTNVQNTNSIIFSGSKLLLGGSNSSTASYYVYSSTDNGANWNLSNTGIPTGYSPNDFVLTAGQELFLASSQYNGSSFSPKLLKSSDNGASWTEIAPLSGLTNLQNTNCITFSNNKLLIAGSNSSTASYYVYSSDLPITTGIEIGQHKTDAVLYPNPFRDELNITSELQGEVNVTITNNLGQIVFSEKLVSNQTINTIGLNCGLYFLTISGQDIQTFKVIKY